MKTTLGFIGGGRVTRILLGGLHRSGAKLPAIHVADPNADALASLNAAGVGDISVSADNGSAAAQDIVFLAVHPPLIPAVLPAIRAALKPDAVVISLAPKFTIARLSELLGGFGRTARMIPNAPSLIGAGFNPIAFAESLGAAERQAVRELIAPLGEAPEVPEAKLEAYALLTAMGPTYLWFQFQVLRELAAGFGLSEAEAAPALKRMVCGSARTLLESGLTPPEVMDLIPVKPLAEHEPVIREAYRTRLPALMAKIKP